MRKANYCYRRKLKKRIKIAKNLGIIINKNEGTYISNMRKNKDL